MSLLSAREPAAAEPRIKRRTVLAWGLWDWGSQAYNTVITSFVFVAYVVAGVVGDARPGGLTVNTWLGISTAAAGVVVLCLAPVIGQRVDAGGHRKRNLAIWSGLVILTMLGLFTVKDDPSYLWIALVLLAAGAVFQELACVSYNAMLSQVSTPQTFGRVSGFGWSMGYFGGIIVLTISLFAFVKPEVGWFGLTADEGLKYRAVAILAAVWFAVFALPVLFAVPEKPPGPQRGQVSFRASYGVLVADVRRLYRTDRNSVMFLIASALYRDGLTAIFTFGAVLAVSVYGFTPVTVVYFGVAANLVAALGALVLGRLEDRVGPKRIIMTSLICLIITATILLFVRGTTLFWVFGLLLCLWVGPAQASSRSFLARVAPPGREGEMFGLYATTGRAASFLAPSLLALFSGLFSDRIGIVAIVVILLAGTLALSRVSSPPVRVSGT